MRQLRSAHSRIRHHYFSNLYGRTPRGPRGCQKIHKNMLQIKVLSSWPFGSQNIKNRVFRFELFSIHLRLCYLCRNIGGGDCPPAPFDPSSDGPVAQMMLAPFWSPSRFCGIEITTICISCCYILHSVICSNKNVTNSK